MTLLYNNTGRLTKIDYIISVAIILIHIAYKLLYIDHYSLWYNEAFYLFHSQQDWGLIKHIAEWNKNAPLYYYFLSVWRSIFGLDEWIVRFSSVLFSALSAGVLYLFVRKNFGVIAAILTLLLFSSSNELFSYARELHGYSLVLFLIICSSWLFFEVLESPRWTFVALLAFCNFLCIYAQYLTFIIPLLQLVIACIYRGQIRYIGAGILLTGLILFLRLTKKAVAIILSHEGPQYNKLYIEDVFYNMFNGRNLLWIYCGIVFACIAYQIYRKNLNADNLIRVKWLYIILCGIPLLFVADLTTHILPSMHDLHFLFVWPFIYILVGGIVGRAHKDIRYAAVAITCMVALGSFLQLNFHAYQSMDYRNMCRMVQNIREPGTLILVETRDMGALFAY
jgi:hypothetical protein